MTLGYLKDAIRRRDQQMLRRALKECEQLGLKPETTPQITHAQRMLGIADARQALLLAIQSNDAERLQEQLTAVVEQNYERSLKVECRKAEFLLQSLQRQKERRSAILDLSRITMSEIRSYRLPVPILHRILQAAFLLLGEDEKTTADWEACKRIALPRGSVTLLQRVEATGNDTVHPEIGARAAQLLETISQDDVKAAGRAAATFYVWAKGRVEEMADVISQSSPADIPRQRQLLGRTTPVEDQMPYLNHKKHRRKRKSHPSGTTDTSASNTILSTHQAEKSDVRSNHGNGVIGNGNGHQTQRAMTEQTDTSASRNDIPHTRRQEVILPDISKV